MKMLNPLPSAERDEQSESREARLWGASWDPLGTLPGPLGDPKGRIPSTTSNMELIFGLQNDSKIYEI